MSDTTPAPEFDDAALDALAEQLIDLPEPLFEPIARLMTDYRRLRDAGTAPQTPQALTPSAHEAVTVDDAQIVLDAAEWLRTLWQVGYMGAGSFLAEPRSAFPAVAVEDILKSALFSRIRHGRQPLPFPPPTRNGVPWHEVVEAPGPFAVTAERVADEDGRLLVVIIDGCAEWRVLSEAADGLIVQHAGKGPHYRLHESPAGARLERLPPAQTVTLRRVERAGMVSYALDWPRVDGTPQSVPLRAATPERAEAAALNWLALHHPDRYGQVRFALADPA